MKKSISILLTFTFAFSPYQNTFFASQNLVGKVVSESSMSALKKPIIYTDNYLTYEQRMEDLNILYDTIIEQNHFNSDMTKEDLNKIKNKIINKINDISDYEFGYELRKLAASKHDTHTKVYGKPSLQEKYLVPLWDIAKFNDGFYMFTTYEEYKDYLENKIVAINGHSIDEILEAFKPYISYENDIKLEAEILQLFQDASLLKYIGIIDDTASIKVTFQSEDGKIEEIEMNTIYSKNMDRNKFVFNEYKQPITSYDYNRIYKFFPLDDNTLFIQYNMCTEDENLSIKDFQDQLEKDINKNKYSKVIFDLRYNTGGQYDIFVDVINKIGELKNKKNFELYTLIGEATFSAGVMHAVDLKNDFDAILVGSETSGNVNFYADNMYFQLPNSKLNVLCSTAFVEGDKNYTGSFLSPDIKVNHSLKDYINGIDKDVETVLEIKK